MPLDSLLIIPLGELPKTEVEAAVKRQFGEVQATWLNRRDLRQRPLGVARQLVRKYDGAVLVAPDLGQSRLRLTSFILALGRARKRWRIDVRGERERWTLAQHLAAEGLAIVRHLGAVAIALVLAEPILGAVAKLVTERRAVQGRPRRLLYLRSQLWLGLEGGGSVAHTAGVIGGLQQAGSDVRVVSSDRLPGVAAPVISARPEMWFDGWLREAEDLAYNVAFFLTALRVCRHFRPEAIYQRHTAFNISGALLSRLLRLPLVLEFNSSEVWKGRHWGGLRLIRAARLVESINLRAADRIIVVSEVLRRELIGTGVAPEKVVANANAVDPNVFRPDAGGEQVREELGLSGAIVIGFSGTFGAWHGVPTLAQVVPMVLRARPEVRWLLIGDGPQRSTVEASERVSMPGMVAHAQMPAYLAACDVLVSPHGRQADGREFFGSPTKLYEYMATGRPIVASAVGQIAEVLQDEYTALLVPPDDAEALMSAILRLVDDGWLRARLGRAAREVAEAHHTWRQNAERVLACVEAE